MREDMFELIIERPRGGGWKRRAGRPPRDLADAPRFESSSRRRGGTKWLNENLAPLVRFLRRRVGCPWNEVHREMAAQLSLDSAVQKHVLDHVWHMIELHPILVDGRPHHPRAMRGRLQPIEDHGWRRSFYVCPATGRLLLAPRYDPPRPAPSRDRVRLDDTHQALRLDGIWYRVQLAAVPAVRTRLRDVVLKRFLDEPGMTGSGGALARLYGRGDRYAVAKQQMSWRAIAALSHPSPIRRR
jgi:hypothetical protein